MEGCCILKMNTDQNTPIALGEVNSERIEIAMPPEGTSDRDRDGNGGHCGIEQHLVRTQRSKQPVFSCPECINPWHGGRGALLKR